MKHPPYHLRPNKAVDRHMLIEVLKRISLNPARDYTYLGFGGPLLEDFRLLAASFPKMKMISVERNLQTFRRQKAHLASKLVTLERETFENYLIHSFPDNKVLAVWIDYTDFQLARFNEFANVLSRVQPGSVVKVTVRCDASQWLISNDRELIAPEVVEAQQAILTANFVQVFGGFLPDPAGLTAEDLRPGRFVELAQEMFQIASQQALPPAVGRAFQLLHSCYYNDGTMMLSITGAVWEIDELESLRSRFQGWANLNVDWRHPEKVDLPILSMKERLLLERFLPCAGSGRGLQRSLGYRIDDGVEASIEQLRQYQDLYPYYPQFVRVNV